MTDKPKLVSSKEPDLITRLRAALGPTDAAGNWHLELPMTPELVNGFIKSGHLSWANRADPLAVGKAAAAVLRDLAAERRCKCKD